MSTPPTPTVNLDSPKEIFDVDDIQQWNQDSTESAKNGTLQEWITEPLQMLTSASSASSQLTNNELNTSPATYQEEDGFAALPETSNAAGQLSNNELNTSPATNQEKDGFAALPETSNAAGQLLSLTTNGQNHLASVPTSNGLATIPSTSNGYHQVHLIPATTSGYHQAAIPGTSNGYHQAAIPGTSNGYYQAAMPGTSNGYHQAPISGTSNGYHQAPIPGTSNGYHQQIPMPVTSNGTNYGHYNYGVHYTNSNGVVGYSPNISNGVHRINERSPTQIVYPLRPNGGYNVNILNGNNGYVNGIVNGRYVRPGWVSTNKVVNGVKKQKRNRTAFTSHQMMELEQEYAKARYLDRTRRIELSETLSLNQRTIKIWFQNRRMKEKKDRLESDACNASDSPPENINDLPIFIQDDSYVPAGENGYYNPALYPNNSSTLAISPLLPSAMPQVHQLPEISYLVENAVPAYNPVHGNEVQAPQPPVIPVNGVAENLPMANAQENWDLSWIRSINISDDMELA